MFRDCQVILLWLVGDLQPITTLAANALAFVGAVVAQATQDLLALYKLGIRSFVVGKLGPLGCFPASTYNVTTGNFTACSELYNLIATAHNSNLTLSVGLSLPADANVIYLNNQLAFSTVTYNLTNPGKTKELTHHGWL